MRILSNDGGDGAMDSVLRKERVARRLLRGFGRVTVAFSGGVDSALLLYLARDELDGDAEAVLVVSPSLPREERAAAHRTARMIGVPLREVVSGEFEDPRYVANGPDRCYWCRSALARALAPLAREKRTVTVYGAIADDREEERPGMRAAREAGIRAPLAEAGLTKEDVRRLARRAGLPVWDKPAAACLASRIPTGVKVTPERLARIERAEERLHALGYRAVRVRDHGPIARIELPPDEIARAAADAARIERAVRGAGYRFVCLDLAGYRPAGRGGAGTGPGRG